jgi:hypothetical protein
MNPGIITSSSKRDSFQRFGGSHSAAPAIAPCPRATSTPPPLRKWWRVIVANMRGSALVRAAASGSIHVITGSSWKAWPNARASPRTSARRAGTTSIVITTFYPPWVM